MSDEYFWDNHCKLHEKFNLICNFNKYQWVKDNKNNHLYLVDNENKLIDVRTLTCVLVVDVPRRSIIDFAVVQHNRQICMKQSVDQMIIRDAYSLTEVSINMAMRSFAAIDYCC